MAASSEWRLLLAYTATSAAGFITDAGLLRLALGAGLDPVWARIGTILCGTQVTFLLSGLFVFKSLQRSRALRQWIGYMATNGLGNACNYLVFVALVSLRARVVSEPMVAIFAGAFCAWVINYVGARFFVFRLARGAAPIVRTGSGTGLRP
jgi:putative flippase GtrA